MSWKPEWAVWFTCHACGQPIVASPDVVVACDACGATFAATVIELPHGATIHRVTAVRERTTEAGDGADAG